MPDTLSVSASAVPLAVLIAVISAALSPAGTLIVPARASAAVNDKDARGHCRY